MRAHIRGLVGTALLWSGPVALAAMVGLPELLSELNYPTDRAALIAFVVGVSSVLTAPVGAWMRRNTRWTAAARWERRNQRSVERTSVFDIAFGVGIAWFSLTSIGVVASLVRVSRQMWSEWREMTHDGWHVFSIVGAGVFAGFLTAIVISAVQLQRMLIGGLWRRTVWSRRRLVDQCTQAGEHEQLREPIPPRIITMYAAALVFLALCLVVIAACVAYQVWIAPWNPAAT